MLQPQTLSTINHLTGSLEAERKLELPSELQANELTTERPTAVGPPDD